MHHCSTVCFVFFSAALCELDFFNYFLKPHESQSHGPVPILDDQEGIAYCAVYPEDGVHINYTVCAYHGIQTGLDWVASPFIANGSSDCCQCGLCDEGVLGPGVTAILGPSRPNSNRFSVPACLVRSKTVVDGNFVCLAHRETEVHSPAKQALALFHFQPPHRLPPQTIIPLPLFVTLVIVTILQCPMVIGFIIFVLCKCKRKGAGSRNSKSIFSSGGMGDKPGQWCGYICR